MPVTAPWVSSDERTIYVAALPDGGAGSYDIYVARRSTASTTFGTLQPVTEINSRGRDEVSWVSEDDCVIVWSSNVDPTDASTSSRVYWAERPK
jgi:hypothetical protein